MDATEYLAMKLESAANKLFERDKKKVDATIRELYELYIGKLATYRHQMDIWEQLEQYLRSHKVADLKDEYVAERYYAKAHERMMHTDSPRE